MFTVIFAEKETIELFEETKMFFGPLYNSEQVAFCEWNKDAADIDTMVPDIYSLIEHQDEWRALIICNNGCEKLNPFDFTEYSESFYSRKDRSWDCLKSRREQRISAYEKAASNPLVKFTVALSGNLGCRSVIPNDEYSLLISDRMPTYKYMLEKQLNALNCLETATRLDKYQRDALRRFIAEDKIDLLISFIKLGDVSGIIDLIPDAEILDFIKFIGNDPMYFDPEYTECLIENTKKQELLKNIADNFSLKDKLPLEVICISPRIFDFEKVEQDIKWKKKDENSSSRFTEFNLYSDKLKFILFDMLPKDNKQYRFKQIEFFCLLLVIANNDTPKGIINPNNVYRAQIEFNSEIITEICEKYISKLKSTQLSLKDINLQLDRDSEAFVDDRTAQRLFESDINIPVKINSQTDENELYAEYKGIGLSSDCPIDETVYWSKQYRNISKRFVRYLREPRRAVKTAVFEGLRENNFIDDDRTLLLSENQIEDVGYHIDELEQKMVEVAATHLFDTKKFTEQIQRSNKEITDMISQRMTKKKTVFVGLSALLAYFIGFLPLIFGNLNTTRSFLFSLMLTGVTMAAFFAVGFVYLFVLRKKLVDRFKHFNYTMSGICLQINSALSQLSYYLSCVCNLMRDFSVLKKKDSAVTKTKRILSYHDMQISDRIKSIYEMFSKYVDFEKIHISECAPYEFDFTVLKDYEYEMPSIYSKKKIDFLQEGNKVVIPVDYVESVMLTREELYD